MPDRETLLALAAKIEAAEAGSRELDAEIFLTQWPGYKIQTDCELSPDQVQPGRIQEPNGIGWLQSPAFTTSLDAAMTLVPEGLMFTVSQQDEGRGVASIFKCNEDGEYVTACTLTTGATPALALCAAALRAKAETL